MLQYTIFYHDTEDADAFAEPVKMEPTVAMIGIPNRLRANEFNHPGKVFQGWKAIRKSDGKTCYHDKLDIRQRYYYLEGQQPEGYQPHLYPDQAGVKYLTKQNDDEIHLYAVWKEVLNNTAQERTDNLRQQLLSRPVVLYGTGNSCLKFYENYKSLLNIRQIVLNNRNEKTDIFPEGLANHGLLHRQIRPRDYVVICCRILVKNDDAYRFALAEMTRSRLSLINDYIRHDVASAILDGKKLWLWYGYCQIQYLCNGVFSKLPSVKKEYAHIYYRLSHHTVKGHHKFAESAEILRLASRCTYMPLTFSSGKMDFKLEDYLSNDCRTVSLPRMVFKAYYPYKDDGSGLKHQFAQSRWPFPYAEQLIDRLILAGMSNEEIYHELMREDLYTEKEIMRGLKLTYKTIQLAEYVTDIKILDFLKENLSVRLLYRDGLHYQNFVFFELSRRISEFLNLELEEELKKLEEKYTRKGIQLTGTTDIPVLPCVAKSFGMDFLDDDYLYNICAEEYGKPGKRYYAKVTRKEWIDMYVDFTRSCIIRTQFILRKNPYEPDDERPYIDRFRGRLVIHPKTDTKCD